MIAYDQNRIIPTKLKDNVWDCKFPHPRGLEACGDKSDQDVICKIVSDLGKSPNPFVFSNGKGPKADGQWRRKAPPKDDDAWKLVWH